MLKSALPLALILAATSPALAQDRSVDVAYGDLDLTSTAGIAEFDRRIDAAVKTVCGAAHIADVKGQKDLRRCRMNSAAAAVSSRLAALASKRGAGSIQVAAVR